MVRVTLDMNCIEVSDDALKSIEDKSINRSSKAIKMPVDKRMMPAMASTAAPGRPLSTAVIRVVANIEFASFSSLKVVVSMGLKSSRNANNIRKFVNEIAD
tara:strand:- start:289 stop:591 length:303 start_codon:yes stop_codon:yes gene_type:complete